MSKLAVIGALGIAILASGCAAPISQTAAKRIEPNPNVASAAVCNPDMVSELQLLTRYRKGSKEFALYQARCFKA